jgi:hypothetical protein
MGLLVACGEDIPPARYEAFTLELVDVSRGQQVLPGTSLAYRTRYVGDLARDLRFTAVFTHEASGESASFAWSEQVQDTAQLDILRRWKLRHDFLKKSGRIRVHLQASLTATRKGSTPWVVESDSVYVELYPALDGLEVRVEGAGQPVPYGTPVEVRVTGKDLWGDVAITVVDVEAGTRVSELDKTLPFDGSQSSLAGTWPLRARALERVGTHSLRVVARYGDVQRESEPIALRVTHTLDQVTILLRDGEGRLGPPAVPFPRLSEVTGLGVRISGTQLAGHEVTVNGGAPTSAPGDQLDLLPVTPTARDFEDGKGRQVYEFVVRSGGIERSASITLQRWGIERCAWRAADGREYGGSESVGRSAQVAMHAWLWGFPDTTGWLFFKRPQAEFTVWERDPGGRPTPGQIDSVRNNDDEGDSFDADVRSGESAASWTTTYEDEFDPLDLHANAAEYYFEVVVEDQRCNSGEILVY